MKKRLDENCTIFSDIFADNEGISWNILKREEGSISVYGTKKGYGGHLVIYDTLDKEAMSDKALIIVSKLRELAGFAELVKEL